MAAAFSANILTSLIDKVLTGFIALMILIRLDQTRRLPALPIGVVRQLSGPTRPRHRSRRRLRTASLSPRTQK